MKKALCTVLYVVMLMSLIGCNKENQSTVDLTQATDNDTKITENVDSTNAETTYIETTDNQTEKIFLPPDDIDLLAAADENLKAFHSLYLNYLQPGNNKLAFHVNKDPRSPDCMLLSVDPTDEEMDFEMFFFPVNHKQIKCYDDLKSLFTEYCTAEFTDKQLKHAYYRDYEGRLYWADNEKGSATPIGCYIDKFTVDKNKMYVDIIEIGADNKLFTKDLSDEEIAEKYPFSVAHDTQFQVTMVWNGEKWLIEGCGEWENTLGMGYSSEITMSQNGVNQQ